jgi:hypothetical protein
MRIKLEPAYAGARQPPAYMTVDELPDAGETLHTETSDVFEVVKIIRTPDIKEHDAIALVKDRVSGAVSR